MTEQNGNSTFTMQTPAAMLAPKQQYLNLMMNSIYKFGELCASPEPTKETQIKIGLLTQMLISYIPNPKERARLIDLRNAKRAETEKIKDIDSQREAKFQVDCMIVGEIMTLMDDILAIVERQAILKTVVTGQSELEKEFYPAGQPVTCIEEPEEMPGD